MTEIDEGRWPGLSEQWQQRHESTEIYQIKWGWIFRSGGVGKVARNEAEKDLVAKILCWGWYLLLNSFMEAASPPTPLVCLDIDSHICISDFIPGTELDCCTNPS